MEQKLIKINHYFIGFKYPQGGFTEINNPVGINHQKDGGIIIYDAEGVIHNILKGWIHMYYKPLEVSKAVDLPADAIPEIEKEDINEQ